MDPESLPIVELTFDRGAPSLREGAFTSDRVGTYKLHHDGVEDMKLRPDGGIFVRGKSRNVLITSAYGRWARVATEAEVLDAVQAGLGWLNGRPPKQPPNVEPEPTGFQPAEVPEVRFSRGENGIEPVPQGEPSGGLSGTIVDALERLDESGKGQATAADIVEAAGLDNIDSVRTELAKMAKEGRLRRVKRGVYALG